MIDAIIKPEAGRLKYIFVWFLSSVMVTIVTLLPDQVAGVVLSTLSEHISLQAAYAIVNSLIALLSVFVLLAVYSIFGNIYIQRVMPYFWLSGVLGFLRVAGSSLGEVGIYYERSGLIYIDLTIYIFGIVLIYLITSNFWPKKYFIPDNRRLRTAFPSSSSAQTVIPSKINGSSETYVRREPPLTAKKSDHFQE